MKIDFEHLSFDVGTGPLVPDPKIMETGHVDLSVYTSQERFERERDMFGRVWLNIAEAAEIPNAGDWIVRDVKIRSVSAIIVRGKDMKIRAFHNICAHRGMKLVWGDKGSGGKFSCPYHAWTYDSAGTLLSIPDEACFPHVEKKESGLTEIRCDDWEGLVFINLNASGTQSLADYLGPLTERVKGFFLQSYPYAGRMAAVIDTNWKLGIEAQCEAYHIRVLHARTVSKMIVTTENPFGHPIEAQLLGAHRMQSHPRNPGYELSPEKLVQTFAFTTGASSIIDLGRDNKPETAFTDHPEVNRTGSSIWGNDQYILYPHFIFHVAPGGWWLHRFWPVSTDQAYWEAVFHFEKPASLREVFASQYSLVLSRDTLLEDNFALAQQQQVMASGAKKIVQFGEQEMLCKHLAAVSEAVTNPANPIALAAE
jgi:phenylpropionate dioxygenase-like ring-hydroxylating dioxygenase large terminal subunit